MKRTLIKSGLVIALSMALLAGAKNVANVFPSAWHVPTELSAQAMMQLREKVLVAAISEEEIQLISLAQASYLYELIQNANPTLNLAFEPSEAKVLPTQQDWLAQSDDRAKLPDVQRANHELLWGHLLGNFERLKGIVSEFGIRPLTNADVENLDFGELFYIGNTLSSKARQLNPKSQGDDRWTALGPFAKSNMQLIERYADYLQAHGRYFGR